METMKPMKPMAPMKPMEPMKPMAAAERWWPDALGEPASSGSQDGMRYAFFPRQRRLLIERDGQLTTYDSGAHDIDGVSQQNGSGAHPIFTSGGGQVNLAELQKL